ncbi:hypothetical protein DSO57_1006822 [Entomophthora muscae]|uniref:Uncharacterized protein n=1 Tax=Entomophthora muscae TaxID=34485 RepID=A0ACC2TUW1_9FUNG|nr:hypothetical protein DSO57_1006822 [Entomophthora muscae]
MSSPGARHNSGLFPGPFLLLLWSTSLYIWVQISSSVRLVENNPSSLLHLLSSPLISGEALVKRLTCDDLVLYSPDHDSHAPLAEKYLCPPLLFWRDGTKYQLSTQLSSHKTKAHKRRVLMPILKTGQQFSSQA